MRARQPSRTTRPRTGCARMCRTPRATRSIASSATGRGRSAHTRKPGSSMRRLFRPARAFTSSSPRLRTPRRSRSRRSALRPPLRTCRDHVSTQFIFRRCLMHVRTFFGTCAVLVSVLVLSASLGAQTGVAFSGRLLNSLSGDPIAGATVQIDELRRVTMSGADGTFTFDNVAPGTYHLSVQSQGYSTRRTEVTVGAAAGAPMDVTVDPELHFEEVTTVTGEIRSQFDLFQPTAVLAGQELTKQLEGSLGATLESQPGVASRSFGPAPARPVIRGLDGDRVLILQDGQRLGDLSSQSGDHGVNVNPAAATRIEVVRGPATLLYGANAIGGLVNIITEDIPTQPVMGAGGNATFDLGSAAREAAGAADVQVGNGTFALTAGGGGRRSDDVMTPEGEVDNSQSRSSFGT